LSASSSVASEANVTLDPTVPTSTFVLLAIARRLSADTAPAAIAWQELHVTVE
jgi:hypothetical protein